MLQQKNNPPVLRSKVRWQHRLRRMGTPPLVVAISKTDSPAPVPSNAIQRYLYSVDESYQQFIQQRIDPLLGGKRHKLMAELDLEQQSLGAIQEQRGANRRVGIGVLVITSAMIGQFIPLITPMITLPLMLILGRYWFGQMLADWRENRKVSLSALNVISYALVIYTGQYVLFGVFSTYFFIILKIVAHTQDNTRSHLIDGFSQMPKQVWVLAEGGEQQISLADLQASHVMVIRAGEVVGADGLIMQGTATLDQHMLTGESQPVEKQVGDVVMAGTLVMSGQLHVQVQETGDATVTAQILDVLNNTTSYQTTIESRIIKFVDQTSSYMVGLTLLGLLTLSPLAAIGITWIPLGVPLIFIAPLSTISILNLLASRQILIKDGRSLELISQIDTVVFDKTGTLTLEQPHIGEIYTIQEYTQAEVLTFAACAEYRQSHPIARAIIGAAEAQGLDIPIPDHTDYASGMGLHVEYKGQHIWVGSERFMQANELLIPDEDVIRQAAESQGISLVYVALDDTVIGVIELLPTYRPEVQTVINDLHERNIEVIVISGDHEAPTRKLAQHFGIDRYYAHTLPEDKAKLVRMLQEDEGRKVCFVGDGINDGIALKTAQVSISIQGSTNVALDAAQVVLMDRTLNQLPYLFDVSRRFNGNMNTLMIMSTVPGAAMLSYLFWIGMPLTTIGILTSAVYAAMIGVAVTPNIRERYSKRPILTLSTPDEVL